METATGAIVDHESRLTGEECEVLRLSLRLLTCTNLIDSSIRCELPRAFHCTLPRFDFGGARRACVWAICRNGSW